MRRVSTIAAMLAGVAFTIAPAALAQTDTTQTRDNPPGHTTSPTEPSAAQNDPANRGATDPARVGTMTTGSHDKNNNRLPQTQAPPSVGVTTSPSTTYETATPQNTTYTDTTTRETTLTPVDTTLTPVDTTQTQRTTLPKTASTTPLAAGVGLLAVGAALALRSRRLLS